MRSFTPCKNKVSVGDNKKNMHNISLRKKLSFIIFILFLSLLTLLNGQAAMAYDKFKAKIDISKFTDGITQFTHSDINPIVITGQDTSGNYDPRFNLADIPSMGQSAENEEKLEKLAKDKVFPYINGSIFYKIALLEKMALWGDTNTKQFAQSIINLTKQYQWESETQRLNSYFIFPGSYQYFLNEQKNNASLLPATENPLYFFPGISYQLPLNDKVFPDEVINKLKSSLNITENSSNKFYFSINKIKDLTNLSFGACYKINPPGKKNSCFNTSKINCAIYAKNTTAESAGDILEAEWMKETIEIKPTTIEEMASKHIYFLHGISCEKIDLLLNNPSSRTGTKTKTTEKPQYFMLLYFHGYYIEGTPGKYTQLTPEQTEQRFVEKVFNHSDMEKIQANYITVWVNEPAKTFNKANQNWGDIPFQNIIDKSYQYCKNDNNKGSVTWDKTKKITIDNNFTATINCGYNPDKTNTKISDITKIAAGHSSAGKAINQAISNENINFSILLDALYYPPVSQASTCTKWVAIQATMTATPSAISDGQKEIEAWKKICPNNITKGSTNIHDDIIKDLPTFLNKKFATSKTSVEEQQPIENIESAPLKEKTLFKPQIVFGDITEGINLPEYINIIYKYLMTFAMVVSGFIIVLGGLKYMIGQNDGIPMIKNALIGIIILASTYLILKTINPAATNMEIIEVTELSRKTYEAKTSLGKKIDLGISSAAGDRSPSPEIEIGNNWYFPVIISNVNVQKFKYNATDKSSGGSFGGWRRTNAKVLKNNPNYPIVCHHAVDIFTEKKGEVVAITDGIIVASGNNFTTCTGGQAGSIIIQHKDKNGNPFIVRYGEIDIVDTAKFKPGATVTAGESLGTATRCGMLHFELHAKANVSAPKWRMPASILPLMMNDYKIPNDIQNLYQVQGNNITNVEKFENDARLKGKNCLDSPSALSFLIRDTANNGQYLLNPSKFLINLWNKTGAIGKQTTE